MPRHRFRLFDSRGPVLPIVLSALLFSMPETGLHAATASSPPIDSARRQDDEAIKAAVIRGIGLYLGQLDGGCFAQDISIGELSPFQTAINKSLNRFIVGAEGAAWLKANSGNAESSHYAWRGIGMTADIIFPFDPRSPDLTMKNRQTMMHEMTHHIEWLLGVKEASRSVMGTPNPHSERNTEYQDKVIDALVAWKKFEDEIRQDPNSLNVAAWKDLENSLRDVTAGAAAGGHRHDDSLQSMTGVGVSFDTIRARYLDGRCGKQFRALVLIAESTGRLDWYLQFEGPNSAILGDTVTLTAGAYNGEAKTDADFKVELKPELGATFRWKIPDVSAVVGNPIKFAPAEAKLFSIPVELTVRHDGQDYVIARGNYDINVEPKKAAAEPPPEKPPVEKPPEKLPVEKPAPPPTQPTGVPAPSPAEPPTTGATSGGHWTLTDITESRSRCGEGDTYNTYANCAFSVSGTTVTSSAVVTTVPREGIAPGLPRSVSTNGSWTEPPKILPMEARVSTTLAVAGGETYPKLLHRLLGQVAPIAELYLNSTRVSSVVPGSSAAREAATYEWWYHSRPAAKGDRFTMKIVLSGPGGGLTRSYTYRADRRCATGCDDHE